VQSVKVPDHSLQLLNDDVRSKKIHQNENSCNIYYIKIKILFNKIIFVIDRIDL